MIHKTFNNQPSPQPESQRENIFLTRCKVSKSVYSLIIDSGLYCNSCSTRLVDKLKFSIVPHLKLYKLHWINEDGDIIIKDHVNVKFSVVNYNDQVLCDVVPMEACHILLGIPWQFDKKTTHNVLTNEITFTHKQKKFVLHPLTPTQVLEDRV